MAITFELGLFQYFKLRRIVKGNYLARIVAFQNGYMIPLSKMLVCNILLLVTPDNHMVAALHFALCLAAISSRLYP